MPFRFNNGEVEKLADFFGIDQIFFNGTTLIRLENIELADWEYFFTYFNTDDKTVKADKRYKRIENIDFEKIMIDYEYDSVVYRIQYFIKHGRKLSEKRQESMIQSTFEDLQDITFLQLDDIPHEKLKMYKEILHDQYEKVNTIFEYNEYKRKSQ